MKLLLEMAFHSNKSAGYGRISKFLPIYIVLLEGAIESQFFSEIILATRLQVVFVVKECTPNPLRP